PSHSRKHTRVVPYCVARKGHDRCSNWRNGWISERFVKRVTQSKPLPDRPDAVAIPFAESCGKWGPRLSTNPNVTPVSMLLKLTCSSAGRNAAYRRFDS